MRKALIFILLIILSGCAVKRVVSEKENSLGILTVDQLIDSVYKKNISEESYFIEKADILITTKEKTEKFLINVKYENPDKFLVSVRNSSGIEGARIFVTKDSVFINDRIKGRLLAGKVINLEKKSGVPFSMQKIIFGDLFFKDEMSPSKSETINNEAVILITNNNYEYRITIDPLLRKVKGYEITNKTNGKTVTLKFENFSKGNKNIPLLISFFDKEQNISGRIKISRIQIPWKGEIEFIPGKGYTKQEIK